MQTKLNSAQPAVPPTFTLRDMILPEPLLERTGGGGNPFLVHGQRRARRPRHFIFMRLLEVLLIFWCFQIIRYLSPIQASMLAPDIVIAAPSPTLYLFPLSRFYLPIPIAIFTFLLLRYHIMLNNHANHIKKLSRDNLAELMLTDLGGQDFFLHPFLHFCRSYRVPIVWAAVAVAACIVKFYEGPFHWSDYIFVVIAGTFNIVMLTWFAAIGQFAIEWKWFAGGGRLRHLRPFSTLFVSAMLAAAIAWYSLFLITEFEFSTILPICVVGWVVALYVVYQIGLWVDYDSEWQLWRRLNPKDRDEMRGIAD